MEPEGPSRLLLLPRDGQSQQRCPASFLGSRPRCLPPAELPPEPCSVYPGFSPTTDSLSTLIFQSYSDKLLQSVVAPNKFPFSQFCRPEVQNKDLGCPTALPEALSSAQLPAPLSVSPGAPGLVATSLPSLLWVSLCPNIPLLFICI